MNPRPLTPNWNFTPKRDVDFLGDEANRGFDKQRLPLQFNAKSMDTTVYVPKNKVRVVTAASLFDGQIGRASCRERV